MNPLTLFKIASRASRLLDLLQRGTRSYEQEGNNVMSKSLFASRIFWTQVITLGCDLSGVLVGVVPAGTLTLVSTVLTVALRLVTKGPVHVLSAAAK